MAKVSFNPALMTAAQNTFFVDTEGYMQGLPLDDWAVEGWVAPGVIASSVTQPVWGGLGVTVAASGLTNQQGQSLGLATTTSLQGFTTFKKGINFIQVPGNSAPTVVAGNSVPFFLFGSNVRMPLPIASGTESAFAGANAATPLYWDTVNLCLTTTSGSNTVALPASVKLWSFNKANSKVVSYNSTTGVVSWSYGQPCAVIVM